MKDSLNASVHRDFGSGINLSESIIGFSLAILAGCGNSPKLTSLPSKFEMDENAIATIGTNMAVFCDEGPLGKIEERTLRLGTTFEYFDSSGEKQATAKQELLSWGVQIVV